MCFFEKEKIITAGVLKSIDICFGICDKKLRVKVQNLGLSFFFTSSFSKNGEIKLQKIFFGQKNLTFKNILLKVFLEKMITVSQLHEH